MQSAKQSGSVVRFGAFELNLRAKELRRRGLKIKLQNQPFQILAMLLEQPGEVVMREQLHQKLWRDGTLVDFEHGLNAAMQRLRQALGDSAERPRFVETLAGHGYRFIAPVAAAQVAPPQKQRRWLPISAAILCLALLGGVAFLIYEGPHPAPTPAQRALTRLTFDSGLQSGATWSPDGRFIAYSSDRGGKFDIYVQQVGSTNPARVTTRPGHNWQPDWSPDGNQIAFRAEGEGGGLFVVPALGGPERTIASFGYYPRWSPDGRRILFQATSMAQLWNQLYLVGLDGSPPREVLGEFWKHEPFGSRSVAWHPDGKRISVWGFSRQGLGFWTVSLDGRTALRSDAVPQVGKQLKEIPIQGGEEFQFQWAPSGTAIYFERPFRGVRSLWRVAVDPASLCWTSLERLTTGPGPDTEIAPSRDGKRLAFTARAERVRIWSFPFDANAGRLLGEGQPVTPPGVEAWWPDLSRDGQKLAYVVGRSGKWELWEESLADGRQILLTGDGRKRSDPLWSPDGRRLACTLDDRPVLVSHDGGNEEPVMSSRIDDVTDWSPDGQCVLVCRWAAERELGGPGEVMWLLPVSAAPHAETQARLVTFGGNLDVDGARFSPDGRWIVFEVVKRVGATNPTLHVVPASGGKWIPLTDGKSWDDKPRWSPDGKTIYFISSRTGFFNVWGIRFDGTEGVPLGEPFRATGFESPALMVSSNMSRLSMSLAQNRLVLSMAETSGSIWMLESVDQ